MLLWTTPEIYEKEIIVGVGQYEIYSGEMKADVALMVKDEYQNKGVGSVLISYLSLLAKRQGLMNFTADVLFENKTILHLLEKSGFDVVKRSEDGVHEMAISFEE
jgi:GNAT superfamily N-acetyltransferase